MLLNLLLQSLHALRLSRMIHSELRECRCETDSGVFSHGLHVADRRMPLTAVLSVWAVHLHTDAMRVRRRRERCWRERWRRGRGGSGRGAGRARPLSFAAVALRLIGRGREPRDSWLLEKRSEGRQSSRNGQEQPQSPSGRRDECLQFGASCKDSRVSLAQMAAEMTAEWAGGLWLIGRWAGRAC